MGDRYFLIGFMGSGKTTLGKVVAEKTGYSFIDMDREIESGEGISIAQIFSKKGEKYFRQLEKECLNRIFNLKKVIVATGGGVPCFADNMEQINSNGKSIYINLTPQQLKVRLQTTDLTSRPLLSGLDDAGLLDFITDRLAERNVFYSKANFIVEGENDDIIIDKIIDIIDSEHQQQRSYF